MENKVIFALLVCFVFFQYGNGKAVVEKKKNCIQTLIVPVPIEKCPVVCPRVPEPVCAADGNTYVNECIMKTIGNLTIVHEGCCEPKCNRICPLIVDPQCGTDGKTYPNLCELSIATCNSDGEITRAYPGKCLMGRELPDACSLKYEPVCGTDGNTYISQCTLNATGCEFPRLHIKTKHEGPCSPKCSQVCTRESDPQCGSDGITYGNPCELIIATCKSDGRIVLAHHGECD